MSKKIAITGATGLLGSHLANYFVAQGHEVFALIKDENSKSLLSEKVSRIFGDISDRSDIEYFIQKSTPHYFFHLAAQTQAYDSLRYPYQTFYNNIVGTLNVMECLREFAGAEAIVVASSDKAYGELVGNSYSENHPLFGIYPYDASKSATDLVANSYRVTYEMPVVITRACNIYGIGDSNTQRLIPGIIYSHIQGNPFKIRNGGSDLREYIHVDDVVRAYDSIVQYVRTVNDLPAFNISSGDRKTTLELFNLVREILNNEIAFEISEDSSLEIKRQFMNSDLLTSATGWKATENLVDTLPGIVNWYLENLYERLR